MAAFPSAHALGYCISPLRGCVLLKNDNEKLNLLRYVY
jgi:hypothetical protein